MLKISSRLVIWDDQNEMTRNFSGHPVFGKIKSLVAWGKNSAQHSQISTEWHPCNLLGSFLLLICCSWAFSWFSNIPSFYKILTGSENKFKRQHYNHIGNGDPRCHKFGHAVTCIDIAWSGYWIRLCKFPFQCILMYFSSVLGTTPW